MPSLTVTAWTTAPLEQARACFTDPAAVMTWNFATDAWSCPDATSDLRPGGTFRYRMAANDGSMAFDFAGTWEHVEPNRLVQVLDDGRRVEITFAAEEAGTRVTQVFDPDPDTPTEVQQAGWQAILHRFADTAGGGPVITLQQLEPRPLVGVRRTLPTTELAAFFAEALPKAMSWVSSKSIAPASAPMAMWCAMDMASGIADCHAGCFVHDTVEGEGDITAGMTQGGDVLTLTHTGSYDTIGRSWMAAYRRASELGREPGPGWEIYIDDPGHTPAERLRTLIHLPLT